MKLPITVGHVLGLDPETVQRRKEMAIKKWHGSTPVACNICQGSFEAEGVFYDAKTARGPWGLLCEVCFHVHGVGLGTGRGQKYDLETLEKLGC
jgi:hypothetical protein